MQLAESRRPQLRRAEESILAKEKIGVGYINYAGITDLVDHFSLKVRQLAPQLILFIDDPTAPGGMELKRRMVPILGQRGMNVPVRSIEVKGKGSRSFGRGAVLPDLSDLPMDQIHDVLILDAITFSGNTLDLARKAFRAEYGHVSVKLGVLVIAQQLNEKQEALAKTDPTAKYLSEVVTDRHEIFFPWGVTQTTAEFKRVFEGATEDSKREVTIAKRPWGTIEILVDEEISSVRFLTIEADQKLSFQRHLCRDELYVALDDNIGLDICAEDIPKNADPYGEDIKSLILEKGDYVFIPRGVWHRAKASKDRARILEVAFGLYSQDHDIQRRWDVWERERKNGAV